MRRILLALLIIGVIGISAFGLTTAFFSDQESSSNNSVESGEIDLLIDNTSYINGVLNEGTTWEPDDLPGHLFFDFTDIKPGDLGEDTISIRVDDNDSWACAALTKTKDDDNTCTDPEDVDDPTCSEPNGDLFDGELGDAVNMVFWVDDGDNVLEDNEATPGGILLQGQASDVLDDTEITLADSSINIFGGSGPLVGGETYYIGKAWCFGTLTLAPLVQDGFNNVVSPANSTGGVTCDGSGLSNATQTDALMADIFFGATQARNNPDFLCEGTPSASPTPNDSPSPSPTPQACQSDVMLVLDRSGSINALELSQLKTAAKDFIDALGLTALGNHAGKASFATTGSLNHPLSDDPVSVKASIDAMVAGGFTNLKEGLDLANTELAGVNDRADLSSPDFMIVITDGHPNRPLPADTADDVAAASADAARAAGVEIFVVGVGADVNTSYLQSEIADDAAHYYSVSDYSGLESTLENIDVCDE